MHYALHDIDFGRSISTSVIVALAFLSVTVKNGRQSSACTRYYSTPGIMAIRCSCCASMRVLCDIHGIVVQHRRGQALKTTETDVFPAPSTTDGLEHDVLRGVTKTIQMPAQLVS